MTYLSFFKGDERKGKAFESRTIFCCTKSPYPPLRATMSLKPAPFGIVIGA
jgi:hypothetical protein